MGVFEAWRSEEQSKAKNRHEAEGISSILSRWMAKNRVRARVQDDSVFGLWPEIVGEDLASVTRPLRLSGGVLTVEVSSAPLLQELATYRRGEILASLRAHPGLENIRDLRFRAGQGS